jgi:hypothetical protein
VDVLAASFEKKYKERPALSVKILPNLTSVVNTIPVTATCVGILGLGLLFEQAVLNRTNVIATAISELKILFVFIS